MLIGRLTFSKCQNLRFGAVFFNLNALTVIRRDRFTGSRLYRVVAGHCGIRLGRFFGESNAHGSVDVFKVSDFEVRGRFFSI